MRSPIEIVDYIFSKGGPLEGRKSHRPAQAELANFRIRSVVERDQTKTRNVTLAEAETGIGKSLAVLIPAAVMARYPGEERRTVIATGTISLRSELTSEKQNDEVNELVAAGFAWAGLPPPDPVIIAERPSYTAFADVEKAQNLHRHLTAHPRVGDADYDHALDYTDYVLNTPDASFDGWLSDVRSNGVMPSVRQSGSASPVLLTPLDLCLSPDDARKAKDKIAAFGEMIERAKDCDIMVVTHTMLVMSNLTFGNALYAKADAIDETGEVIQQSQFRDLVIDEADNLLSLSKNITDQMIELDDVREFLESVGNDEAENALELLDRVSKTLTAVYPQTQREHPQSLTAIPGFDYHAFMDLVDRLYEGIENAAVGGDAVTILRAESLCRVLGYLIEHRARAGTTTAEASRSEYTKTMPFVDANYADRSKLRIGTKPTKGRGLTNRLWLSTRHSSFETIALMSATLTASNLSFRNFQNRIGVYEGETRDIRTEHFHVDDFGKIDTIYYADYAVPPPTLNPPSKAGSATGENTSGVSFDNPDYLDFVAKAILYAHTKGSRSLVLFSSAHALLQVNDRILASGYDPRHLFVQNKGMKTRTLMDDFAKSSGIWLGLKWAGENFVHPETGQSLLNRVMVAKIPFPITNPVREAEDHFLNSVEDGVRVFRQGIGRGIRTHNAVIDLWILDPRFPKPRLDWESRGTKIGSARFKQVAHMAIPERFRKGPQMAKSRLILLKNDQVSIEGRDNRLTFSSRDRPKIERSHTTA